MEIDSKDEIFYMGSKNPHMALIIKGKRTKRPRQQSKIRSSESLCSEISTTTEEDEDMANCLILLARTGRRNSIQIKNNIEKQEGDDEVKLDKYSSRKLKEMTITTSSTIVGKASIYVYECKTCDRCFPSFQALGGHRTSHKMHKPTVEKEETTQKKLPPHDVHHQEENAKKKNAHGSIISNNNKAKIHECSICGAEFASGQALGGHMRRHRNLASATTSTTDDEGDWPRNAIQLDLNFPAPPEDDHYTASKFQLSLFSSPALVDC